MASLRMISDSPVHFFPTLDPFKCIPILSRVVKKKILLVLSEGDDNDTGCKRSQQQHADKLHSVCGSNPAM